MCPPDPSTRPAVPLLVHRFRAGSGLVALERDAFEQLKKGKSVKLPNDVWHPPPLYARELIALDPEAAALDFESHPTHAIHTLVDHAAYCARSHGRLRMVRPLAEILKLHEPPDRWVESPPTPSPIIEDRLDAQAFHDAAQHGSFEGRWAVCESGDPACSAEYVLIKDHVCQLRCRRVWNRLSEIQLFPFAIKK